MKTPLTLLWLIGGSLLAGAASPTAEFVQDKPDRLYVASDTLSKDSYGDNVTSDNAGGVAESQLWHHDDYHWRDGIGGNGSRQDVQQSDDWDSDGYLWGFTNRTSSLMTWTTNGTGTEVVTANDGSTASYPIGLPQLTSEHCVVNDPQSPPLTLETTGDGNWTTNQLSEEYVRYSQTRWRLQTGGRGRRSSLFRLSATATRILDKRAERSFGNVDSQAVPAQSITVGGRALYADGNFWTVLPNGIDLDVTPFVAGADFYTMDVSEQKYIPIITVNDVSLDGATPEFCAGQHLDFQLVFDPPPEAVSQVSVWELSGGPVNESWQASPSGSVNYRFNRNLLTNLTTSCWYVDGGPATASVDTLLQLANGQYCFLDVQGSFSIARPSFSGFDNGSGLVGFAWSSPLLQASMQWGVTVQSAYDGAVAVTQLISGTNLWCDTGGEFRLDGACTSLPGQAYSAADPATQTARFLYARSATANPAVAMTAAFEDYLRFKPSGDANNIWVTLAHNSWSMDGAASLSGGLTRSNLPPAGALVESAEFPVWTSSYGP